MCAVDGRGQFRMPLTTGAPHTHICFQLFVANEFRYQPRFVSEDVRAAVEDLHASGARCRGRACGVGSFLEGRVVANFLLSWAVRRDGGVMIVPSFNYVAWGATVGLRLLQVHASMF